GAVLGQRGRQRAASAREPPVVSGGLRRGGAGQPGAGEPPIKRLVRHLRAQDRAHRDQLLDIDAGGKALALAEEHQVLEYDIAGGARRERAAAKATERAVEDARAFVERRG